MQGKICIMPSKVHMLIFNFTDILYCTILQQCNNQHYILKNCSLILAGVIIQFKAAQFARQT